MTSPKQTAVPSIYRRELLTAVGTSVTAGLTGCTGNGDDGTVTQEIELVARADGWEGVKPPEIEGERNPRITLVAGWKYLLTWENGDGNTHDIRIVTAADESILNSDDSRDRGQSVTVEFTASQEMSEYYCTYHPESMRGSIRITETT